MSIAGQRNTFRTLLGLGILLCAMLFASGPSWWTDEETAIIDSTAMPNDYAPATLGQLKHVATQAKKHFDEILVLSEDGSDWDEAYGLHEQNPFRTGGPLDPNAQEGVNNLAPANQGQVKHIAEGFYKLLENKLGIPAAQEQIQAQLSANLLDGQLWGHPRPWTVIDNDGDGTDDMADDANHAPITLGQLKFVFSADAAALVLDLDDDGDGLPDPWEQIIINAGLTDQDNDGDVDVWDVLAEGDFDGDGLSNIEEYQNHTNPLNPDTDGDGMIDGWEVFYDFPPLPQADEAETGAGQYYGTNTFTNIELFLSGFGPLQIPFLNNDGSDYLLEWFAVNGIHYTLKRSTNLVDWVSIRSVHGDNNVVSVRDPLGFPQFYRLEVSTAPYVSELEIDPLNDSDHDTINDNEDADPLDPTIGRLNITITSPGNGGSVN